MRGTEYRGAHIRGHILHTALKGRRVASAVVTPLEFAEKMGKNILMTSAENS